MNAILSVVVLVALLACALIVVVGLGVRRAKRRVECRAAFEQAHGLKSSIQPGELGSRYLATGTVAGVAVTIESERVRRSRGAGYLTRVRGSAPGELGSLVVLRRALEGSEGVAVGLPEQKLDDPSFDAKFRTLCASAAEAQAMLTPELRRRLTAQVGVMKVGVRSLEVAGREVVYTMAWTLVYGMDPKLRDTIEEALAIVTTLCRSRGP